MDSYFSVAINNGIFDIDYKYLLHGLQKSETEAYVKLQEGYEVRESWIPITEVQFIEQMDVIGVLKKTLVIEGKNLVAVNVPETFTVKVLYPEDTLDTNETRTIRVVITGPGQRVEFTLTPVNGQADFDFESPIPGTFTITATADFACDPGILEVTVQ